VGTPDSERADSDLSGRRVFVVEDESLVTMLIEDTLADIGCEIAGLASRFNDAMEKAQSLAFDVAILDVNLNGQHTFPIAMALTERGLPFVFATGYGVSKLPTAFQAIPVLQKPFQQRALEQALRTVLRRDPQTAAR